MKKSFTFKNFCTTSPNAWNQVDAPLLLENFPKRPRTPSEASQSGGSHKYKTKQNKTNKQPCFIDRLVWPVPFAQVLLHVQPIFPSKTRFYEIYLNFQQQNSL
jgi:hypothetical protein